MAATTKTDILWEYNDKFHDYMGHLAQVKGDEDIVYVPVPLVQSIIKDIEAARAEVEKTPELKKFKSNLDICQGTSIYDCFIALSKIADKLKGLAPTADFVVMSKAAWNDLQTPFLNDMANLVHIAGGSLIGATGTLKGCNEVGKFKPDDGKMLSKYCSGVTTGNVEVTTVPVKKVTLGDGKTLVQQYPTLAKHSLGCHSVMPSFATSGDENAMAVEYHDSDGHFEPGSTYRLKGVAERLALMGFQCGVKNPSGIKSGKDILYCNKPDVPPDEARLLSTYFSYLLNGDTSGEGKAITPLVRDYAFDFAKTQNEKYGDMVWQQAHKGQVNWQQLKAKMDEDEKYNKNVVYHDLRDLLILRDIHHMVEEKYKIDSGHATLEGMKLILANGKKMQTIIAKNKWASIQHYLNELEGLVQKSKATNIAGVSDAIGHVTHAIIYEKLSSAGQYGGCTMAGNIVNINTGNLAYCEGILEGESGSPIHGTAGNSFQHKVLPMSVVAAVDEDDFADNEYTFKIHLPADEKLNQDITQYLKTQGLSCSGNVCKAATKDLNQIRQMALFLSNLKGADIKVGEECAKKAIESAAKAAIDQNKKGVFAFTQQPIHTSTKEWIDLCFKQYGIAPPGMTKEELDLLKLIGPNKTYGGCYFGNSEILPNLGYLKYCEGVRKNPTADINAYLNTAGTLDHFFHGSPGSLDKVATIDITPEKQGGYELSLSNLHMRDKDNNKPLQKLVIKRLESVGLTCPDITQCKTATKPQSEAAIRHLAAYLSSMHQAYNVEPSCIPLAEEYAWKKAVALPNDVTAHDSMVHPFQLAEWNNEVCAKKEKPPVGAPTMTGLENKILGLLTKGPEKSIDLVTILATWYPLLKTSTVEFNAATTKLKKEGKIAWDADSHIWSLAKKPEAPAPVAVADIFNLGKLKAAINAIKGKPKPFEIGGCVSQIATTPTVATAAFCAGIQNLVQPTGAIPAKVTVAKLYPANGHLAISGAGSPVIFSSKGNALYFTLPPEMMHPEVVAYLDFLGLHQVGNTWSGSHPQALFRAGKFLSSLQNFPLIPEDCKDKAVKNAIKQAAELTFGGIVKPFYKDQWDAFCAEGKAPEAKKMAFSALTTAEQEKYNKWICSWKGAGKGLKEILDGFSTFWPEVEFGATTKGILTKMYEKCPPSEIAIDEESYPHQVPLVEPEKAPTVKELTAFVHKIFTSAPNVVFTISEIVKLVGEVLTASPQDIFQTIKYLEAHGLIANMAGPGEVSKYTWAGAKPEAKPDIDKLIEESQIELNTAAGAFSGGVLNKAVQVTEYKKLPQPVKNWMHALFNFWLLKAQKDSTPEDKLIETLQEYLLKVQGFHITPLMVKLQVQLEKQAKINKGELPECDVEKCTPKVTKYEDMSKEEQDGVKDYAKELVSGPLSKLGLVHILGKVEEKYGLEYSLILDDMIKSLPSDIAQEAKAKPPLVDINDLPAHKRGEACADVQHWFFVDKIGVMGSLLSKMHEKYGVHIGNNLESWISKRIADKKSVNWDDLDATDQCSAKDDAMKLVQEIPGEKIMAIKHLRCLYRLGLKDAKELIEYAIDIKPDIPEAEETGNWYFDVVSETYGTEEFGPYDTKEEADGGIASVQEAAIKLKDGIHRDYSEPYQKEEEGWVIGLKKEKPEAEAATEPELEQQNEYGSLPNNITDQIDTEIEELVKKGGSYQPILTHIVTTWHMKPDDPTLHNVIKAAIAKHEKAEAEKPPIPSEQIEQESMASFIKQGMSAKAVAELFGTIVGEGKMKKTADKLYNLYHPDQEVMTQPLTAMPAWVQNKVKAVAESWLASGKTQEDTVWYIAFNYHLTKESVKHLVNSLAKIPISKTQELLKAFKTLAIGQELGGCTVANGGLGDLKGQTVSYCQGVVAPIGSKPKAEIQLYGVAVHHTTDHQAINMNTKTEEETWTAQLDYQRDLTGENPAEYIARTLRDWGFSCEKNPQFPQNLVCQYRGSDGQTMSIEDQDSLRKTALFLSSIDYVPLLPKSCQPKAMEYAKNHSIAVAKTSKPWTVSVFPHSTEEWQKMVCQKVG